MSGQMGILFCLVVVSMGLTTYAIAVKAPEEKESNEMESSIKSRSDDPDYDDLSSFFDFEIGPPSITYKDATENDGKTTLQARLNGNKKYYYYHSDGFPKEKDPHISSSAKKKVVTPGTHYKSSTEKTFVEDEGQSNDSSPVIYQENIGGYQVSVVDANSPLISNLGLTQEDLAKLTAHSKRSITNASMLASDSTQSATYAENPRPNYPPSGYSPTQNAPSYQPPNDPSKYPPPPASNNGEIQYKPNDHYSQPPAPRMQSDHNRASYPSHPPPQGSYDAKSYRAVQNGSPQGSSHYNYPPPSHNNYPPPVQSYNNPPAPYSHPPPSTSYNPHPPASTSYNSHPPASTSYNHPPPQTSYHNQPPAPTTYNPQRSSGEPWRQSSQYHTDWDDGSKKQESSWHSGSFPPHPPPLPHSSPSSNSGSYHSKPSYGPASDKYGHRLAATYVKPESSQKPSYSSSPSSSSSGYNSRKPYYSPSSYSSSSSSKGPERGSSESYAESSYHHHSAPSKPGITIRFKAKSPGHGHGHGVSIPVSLGPLDLLKKLSPLSALNPLNNKKVTIGITIENKPHEPHHEYTSY